VFHIESGGGVRNGNPVFSNSALPPIFNLITGIRRVRVCPTIVEKYR